MSDWASVAKTTSTRILPRYKEKRRKRNEIKSEYRKNIQRIKAGDPVKTLDGYDTHVLGDEIEEMHWETWATVKDWSIEKDEETEAQRKGGNDLDYYRIQYHAQSSIIRKMQEIIDEIEMKNRRNKLIESIIFPVYFIIVCIGIGGGVAFFLLLTIGL